MVSATVEEADDTHLDDDDNKAELLTTYIRRPQHDACLAEIFSMDSDELLVRLTVKKYDRCGFIPTEVLVTLARNRYGIAQIRKEVALALNERLLVEIKRFVSKNPQWYGVMNRSSESEVEAVAYIRERIFSSTVDVSFPEVAFGPFVGTRLLDWFKSEIRLKNSLPSVDAIRPPDDDDGNQLSLTEQVADDIGLTPEELFTQKRLFERCRNEVFLLPPDQRMAISLCILQDMTHKQAAELMGRSESSIQKYIKKALKALRDGVLHEL